MQPQTHNIMDYKKVKTNSSTVTRNVAEFNKGTDNIYKTVTLISKRSNQITLEIKKELTQKLEEFALSTDNLEEIFENREQIEIAKYYERLPKPTLIAVHEFLHNQLAFREATDEEIKKRRQQEEAETR